MNLVMPGLDGLKKMADLMACGRPPTEIAAAVRQQKDYQDGSVVNVADGSRETMELSGSNAPHEMADGTSLIVRPSGTEPKVTPPTPRCTANGSAQKPHCAWGEQGRRFIMGI